MIAENAGATAGERLTALRDLEKSLGWTAPDTLTMNHAAVVEHRWTLEDIRVEPGGRNTSDVATIIIHALIDRAKAGDMRAAAELFDRG